MYLGQKLSKEAHDATGKTTQRYRVPDGELTFVAGPDGVRMYPEPDRDVEMRGLRMLLGWSMSWNNICHLRDWLMYMTKDADDEGGPPKPFVPHVPPAGYVHVGDGKWKPGTCISEPCCCLDDSTPFVFYVLVAVGLLVLGGVAGALVTAQSLA